LKFNPAFGFVEPSSSLSPSVCGCPDRAGRGRAVRIGEYSITSSAAPAGFAEIAFTVVFCCSAVRLRSVFVMFSGLVFGCQLPVGATPPKGNQTS
jgi:hypothetical protein